MRLTYRPAAIITLAATGVFAIAVPVAAAAYSGAGATHRTAISQRSTAVPGGTQVWVQRFSRAHLSATASSVAASPDKAVVYVTGITTKTSIGLRNEVTVAYNTATGHQLWLASCRTANMNDNAAGLAVSPDGSTVYVTGTSIANYNTPADYATVAYLATSGAQLWSARYTVTGAQNNAAGVVVSGGNAIVTGTSGPFGGQSDIATVAYQGG